MTEFNKENTDDWKEKLRSAFISAFSGNPQENIQVYTEVGYYYMCCAPSSLYKYYSDRQEKLETVKHNKMWYSAPCNFNDVFDCDMSMDEEGIFQSILQMYPDKRGIREGSPIWRDLLKTCRQQIRTFQSSYDILKSRIHKREREGRYYARPEDCSRCAFNYTLVPKCKCLAMNGIQHLRDIKLPIEQRMESIQKLQKENDERHLLIAQIQKDREQSLCLNQCNSNQHNPTIQCESALSVEERNRLGKQEILKSMERPSDEPVFDQLHVR